MYSQIYNYILTNLTIKLFSLCVVNFSFLCVLFPFLFYFGGQKIILNQKLHPMSPPYICFVVFVSTVAKICYINQECQIPNQLFLNINHRKKNHINYQNSCFLVALKKKKKKTPKFKSFLPTYYQKKDHINPFFILIISALPIKNNTLKMNACTLINM